LATLLVVVVTSIAGSSDLSLRVAYRSAGNVALPSLDSFFDRSLSDDRSRKSKSDRSQKKEDAREELHGGGLS